MATKPDTGRRLLVVGGGVVGLSVAWEAAADGYAVTVVDADAGRSASQVAAGMLAPLAEAWPGEEAVLELGCASLALWPSFADRLRDASGVDPCLSTAGTVLVAVDSADAEVLTTLADHLAAYGHDAESLTRSRLRKLEPSLAAGVRGGLHLPGDLSVDNRALLTALREAAVRAGVRFDRRDAREVGAGGVALDDGSTLDADVVAVCAGAWSGGLHPALRDAIRPVKGELLRLRARRTSLPPPTRTVRAVVEGRALYLVPRASGELVVGATQYEAGFDTDVTAGGVRDLLRDTEYVLPGIDDYALVECQAGFRAGSLDNLPLVGWLEPGVLVAAGHHRNGLLAAPVTSAAVRALVAGDQPPAPVRAADPARTRRTACTYS